MDAKRLQQALLHLELLDDRLLHKVRPRHSYSMGRMTQQQIEDRLKDLADYTVELKDTVREILGALSPPTR